MNFSFKNATLLKIFIVTILVLIITVVIYLSKYNNFEPLEKSINDTSLVERPFEKIEFIIKDNFLLQNNHIDYILSSNNHKVSFEIKDKNLVSFIEFDGNLMNSENKDSVTKIFSTTYEIVPSTYKIKIYFNDGTIGNYDIDIKYLYKSNISKKEYIDKYWIFSPQIKYNIGDNGIILLGQYANNQPTMMQYYKDFDRDISMRLDFEVLKDNVTDLKFSFGERISLFFNNNRIDIYRREFNKNTKKNVWVKHNFIKDFSRLKKGVKYSIYLKRFKENTYSIELIDHSNNLQNKSGIYIDDKKNQIEFERYKNLRILVGSEYMEILIKEIELN